jgi:hypothetical protein
MGSSRSIAVLSIIFLAGFVSFSSGAALAGPALFGLILILGRRHCAIIVYHNIELLYNNEGLAGPTPNLPTLEM